MPLSGFNRLLSFLFRIIYYICPHFSEGNMQKVKKHTGIRIFFLALFLGYFADITFLLIAILPTELLSSIRIFLARFRQIRIPDPPNTIIRLMH